MFYGGVFVQLVTASNLTKEYNKTVLFSNFTFQIDSGKRIGLIGQNGTGKTSLMKIIAGEESHFGTLIRRRGLKVIRMEQNPTFNESITVRESLMTSLSETEQLEREIEHIHNQLASPNIDNLEDILSQLEILESRFQQAGGHDAMRQMTALLDGFGIPASRHDITIQSLSGGERNRVALAQLLLKPADLWLLDEPTNHLDLDGIEFLERFLQQNNAAALIVSHDRRFLDDVTTSTWEIENGKLYTYAASYTRAKEIRAEQRLALERASELQREYIAKEEEYIRRYGAGQRAKQATGRAKRLSRLERIDATSQRVRITQLNLPICQRLGTQVLELTNVTKAYDKLLFSNLTIELEAGETLAIAGPNGSGKTTLLRMLLREESPDSGQMKWGQTVKLGVLKQHEIFPNDDLTPLEFVQYAVRGRSYQEYRDTFGAMLFRGEVIERPVRYLSGGEKKRLMLTRLLLEGHNVLILDEPTNHLDVESCETLEMALSAYDGTVILVSHDRYLMDNLADRVLWLDDGEWRITRGGFNEAAQARELSIAKNTIAKNKEKAINISDNSNLPNQQKAMKRPYEKWKLSRIESEIAKLELRRSEIENLFSQPDIYENGGKMKQLSEELSKLQTELNALENEFLLRG